MKRPPGSMSAPGGRPRLQAKETEYRGGNKTSLWVNRSKVPLLEM